MLLQVFAIELVTFAVDFVPLAADFGAFAVEFVALALQFIALAIELGAFALKFVMTINDSKKLTAYHEVNDFCHGGCHLRQKKASEANFTCCLAI